MARTFAYKSYREKLLGGLTFGQTVILGLFCLPALLAASRGEGIFFAFGLALAAACYAGLAFYDADRRALELLGFAGSVRRLPYGSSYLRRYLGIESIGQGKVKTMDGRFLAVFRVFPRDLGGLSDEDRDRALAGYGRFLAQLADGIQICMGSAEVDLDHYLGRLREKVMVGGKPGHLEYLSHFESFLKGICASKVACDRAYHLIVWARGESDLESRARGLSDSLGQAGIETERVGTAGLYALYHGFFSSRPDIAWTPPLDLCTSNSSHRAIRSLLDFCDMADPLLGLGSMRFDGGQRYGDHDMIRHIMPESLELFPSYARAERLHRVLYAARFPAKVNPGWLTGLIRSPIDLGISMHIHPMGKAASLDYLQRELRKLETDVTERLSSGLLVPEADKSGLLRVRELSHRVSADEEGLFEMSMYFDVRARDKAGLDKATARVRTVLEGMGVSANIPRWDMGAALGSCYPTARDMLGGRGGRIFPSSAVADSYPFILSAMRGASEGDLVAGYNQLNGMPVLFDMFTQPNPHCLVLGSSGSGKSFLVKKLVMNMALQGARIFIVDPQGEYKGIVEKMGGRMHVFGPDTGCRINLFDIGGDSYDGRKSAAKAFFNILRGGGTAGDAEGLLDKMVDAAYRKRGIYRDDPATHDRPPPTLSDIHDCLDSLAIEARAAGDRWRAAMAESMLARLSPLIEGELRYFCGQTTVTDFDAPIVCFDLSHTGAFGQTERALALFIAFDRIFGRARAFPRHERKAIVIDEAWMVFGNNEDYVGPMVRTGRKENISVIMADQNAEDLLALDGTGQARGHVVLNNTATKFVFRCEPAALPMLSDRFSVTDAQLGFLRQAQTGDALMLTPSLKLPIYVLASRFEAQLLSTTPDKPPDPKPAGRLRIEYAFGADAVIPAAEVSKDGADELLRLGYVRIADEGLDRGGRSVFFIKGGEEPVSFVRMHLARKYLSAMAARLCLSENCFRLLDGAAFGLDIMFCAHGRGYGIRFALGGRQPAGQDEDDVLTVTAACDQRTLDSLREQGVENALHTSGLRSWIRSVLIMGVG